MNGFSSVGEGSLPHYGAAHGSHNNNNNNNSRALPPLGEDNTSATHTTGLYPLIGVLSDIQGSSSTTSTASWRRNNPYRSNASSPRPPRHYTEALASNLLFQNSSAAAPARRDSTLLFHNASAGSPGTDVASKFLTSLPAEGVPHNNLGNAQSKNEVAFGKSAVAEQYYYTQSIQQLGRKNSSDDCYLVRANDPFDGQPRTSFVNDSHVHQQESITHDESGGNDAQTQQEFLPASTQPTVTAEELLKLLETVGDKGEVCCSPGWTFSVYDADIRQHYSIKSDDVVVTRGVIKYLTLYGKYGVQTRFRFQLCKRYLQQRCTSGSECQYIHSRVVPASTWVHINENRVTTLAANRLIPEELAGGRNTLHYITMPAGVLFSVHPPNQSHAPPQAIPSELILHTVGAANVYRVLANNNGNNTNNNNYNFAADPATANLKPRHCAHFQFKRMCNLGTSCNFIHSLVPFVQGVLNQPAGVLPMQQQQQQQHDIVYNHNNVWNAPNPPPLPGPPSNPVAAPTPNTYKGSNNPAQFYDGGAAIRNHQNSPHHYTHHTLGDYTVTQGSAGTAPGSTHHNQRSNGVHNIWGSSNNSSPHPAAQDRNNSMRQHQDFKDGEWGQNVGNTQQQQWSHDEREQPQLLGGSAAVTKRRYTSYSSRAAPAVSAISAHPVSQMNNSLNSPHPYTQSGSMDDPASQDPSLADNNNNLNAYQPPSSHVHHQRVHHHQRVAARAGIMSLRQY